jgi:hypothetical protein
LIDYFNGYLDTRRSLGVPEAIANSTLAHPELGDLGSAIESERLTSYLMVIHDPQLTRNYMSGLDRVNSGRKMTLWSFGENNPPVDSESKV